jgi:transposase
MVAFSIEHTLIYLAAFPSSMPVDFGKTGETVRKIVTAAREGVLAYEKREPTPRSWSAYDLAQTREIADTLELTRHLVEAAEARLLNRVGCRARKRGRPPTPAADIAKVLIMQTYFGVPNRVAEGLILLFGEKLGLSREFSYKAIERGYDRETVNRLLDEVVALTNIPIQGLETTFSADGTGMPTSGKENYANQRDRQSSEGREAGTWPGEAERPARREYVFGVGILGTKYKLYSAWSGSCDRHVGELALFPELLVRTKELHPGMEMLVGDGLYAGRPQCDLVAKAGAVPRFLPRRNVTLKREGVKAWAEMLLSMAEDPQQWFREYYQREASECGFAMVKKRKGALRKRLRRRKETETYLRFVQHNVTRLAQLRWVADIIPWSGALAE